MPQKQKLKADLVYAFLGNALHKLIGFVIVAVLARYVDKGSMGEFFFAMSVATIIAMATELGTSRYLVRKIAADPTSAAQHLASVLLIRLPLLVCGLILAGIILWALAFDSPRIFLLTSTYVLLNDLYYAFAATLIAVRAVAKRVATGLTGPGLLLLIVLWGAHFQWSFDQLLLAHVVSSIGMIALAAWVTLLIVGPLDLVVDRQELKHVLMGALPFFALSILTLIHTRLDEIMLALLRSYEDVASYAASYKLIEVSRFVIRPITMVLFPVFVAAAAGQNWSTYRENTWRLVLGVAVVGLAMTALVIPSASWVIPLIYGNGYQSSVPITQVLFLAAPTIFVGQAAVLVANSLYLDRLAIGVTALGLLGNGVANLAVIPRWGGVGAAWITLATETLVTSGLLVAVWYSLRQRSDGARASSVEPIAGLDTGP